MSEFVHEVKFLTCTFLGDRAEVEVEPSLFVGLGMGSDDDSGTDSSLSWQHVQIDPQTTPDKQKHCLNGVVSGSLGCASVALQSSVTNTRTLVCTPCEGLVLPSRYCRAIICIRAISAESVGLINLSENAGNAQGELELQDRILQAIATLKFRVFEEPARLSWSDITVRFPPVDPHH